MQITINVKNATEITLYRTPNPNMTEFQRLFTSWGISADTLQALRIYITFCGTECRGEYLGCRDGIHCVELKNLYLLAGVPQHFLEQVTVHELRHIWWALQNNPPAGLGEEDCQRAEKEYTGSSLWKLDAPQPKR